MGPHDSMEEVPAIRRSHLILKYFRRLQKNSWKSRGLLQKEFQKNGINSTIELSFVCKFLQLFWQGVFVVLFVGSREGQF